MVNRISLKKILETECTLNCSGVQAVAMDTHIVTNAWEDVHVPIVIASGSLDELARFPDQYPDEVIRQMAELLNPKVYHDFVSPEHEKIITRAAMRNEQKPKYGHIGWVDMQQIGILLQSGEKGIPIVYLSNDPDILETVEHIKEDTDNDKIRENIQAISVRNYLKRKHWSELKEYDDAFKMRRELRKIERSYYLKAA